MSHSKMCKNTPVREIFNDKLPPDLFGSYTTTNQNDYKKYCDAVRTSCKFEQKRVEDPPKVVSRPYEREDHGSFAKYHKGAEVPIELYSLPKPITRTNPHIPFKELGELPHTKKDEAIKSRPRLYMVPAIPIDDIKEPDQRKLLCRYMYTTQGRKAERDATVYFKPVKPRIDQIETSDKVTLRIDFTPPLKEQFREVCREWDHDQVRGNPNPTKEFWIRKDPPVVCGACVDPYKNLVPEKVKKEITGLVKEERLVSAHDTKPGCTYTGFKPRLPMGIALEKKHLSTLHPLVSVTQIPANRTPKEVAELTKIYNSEHQLKCSS